MTYTVSCMNTEDTKPRWTTPKKPLFRPNVDDEVKGTEAARLKEKYRAAKLSDPTLNQEKIADLCGWSGQSVVSQYLNGKIALNLSALLKFANVLHFDPAEVSERLASSHGVEHMRPKGHLPQIPSENVGYGTREEYGTYHVTPIEIWDDATPLSPDEVELPFFKEIEISAGIGTEVMLETTGRKLRFGKRTLQRKNVNPETAGCALVAGNSMEPVLPDGSTVGIDTANTAVQDGKMYALDHDGLLRVKLLYRQPGGGLRIKSYNSEEHPDERYDGQYVNDHIRIIGKVFWYSVLI